MKKAFKARRSIDGLERDFYRREDSHDFTTKAGNKIVERSRGGDVFVVKAYSQLTWWDRFKSWFTPERQASLLILTGTIFAFLIVGIFNYNYEQSAKDQETPREGEHPIIKGLLKE